MLKQATATRLEKKKIVFYFFFFFSISMIGRTLTSEIRLVIEGGGQQSLLNESFYRNPSKVFVNGELKESCVKSCELESGRNNITLVFEDEANSCENMFHDLAT